MKTQPTKPCPGWGSLQWVCEMHAGRSGSMGAHLGIPVPPHLFTKDSPETSQSPGVSFKANGRMPAFISLRGILEMEKSVPTLRWEDGGSPTSRNSAGDASQMTGCFSSTRKALWEGNGPWRSFWGTAGSGTLETQQPTDNCRLAWRKVLYHMDIPMYVCVHTLCTITHDNIPRLLASEPCVRGPELHCGHQIPSVQSPLERGVHGQAASPVPSPAASLIKTPGPPTFPSLGTVPIANVGDMREIMIHGDPS